MPVPRAGRRPSRETALRTCSLGNFPLVPVHRKPLSSWGSVAGSQLEWGDRLMPSTEEGVGWGRQGDDHNPSLNCNRGKKMWATPCSPQLTLLRCVWLRSFHQPSLNLTPFWDVCLPARKCLITFEYKGSSLATKEIILSTHSKELSPPNTVFPAESHEC